MDNATLNTYLTDIGIDANLLSNDWASLTAEQQTTVYQFAATTPGGCPRPSPNNLYNYGDAQYAQQVGPLFAKLSDAQRIEMLDYGQTTAETL